MSIVFLESPAGAPSQFVNRFDEPLVFDQNSTVALINMTVQLNKTIDVVAGLNDTLAFQIGQTGPLALQRAVTLTPGQYDPSSLRTELEFQMNASTNRLGSAWYVRVDVTEGKFTGYTLRCETSYADTAVPFDQNTNTAVTTAGTESSVVKTSGTAGWNASAYSSAPMNRGNGYSWFEFPLNRTAAVGVIANLMVDPQPSNIDYGYLQTVNVITLIVGGNTVAPIAPIPDNTAGLFEFRVFKNLSNIMLQHRVNDSSPWITDGIFGEGNGFGRPPVILHPIVLINSASADPVLSRFIPDNFAVMSAGIVGYYAWPDQYSPGYEHSEGFSGSNSGYTARTGGVYKIYFFPGTAGQILGFKSLAYESPAKQNSWSVPSDAPTDVSAAQQQLYVCLPGLPIDSRSGPTGQNIPLIAAVLRLDKVSETMNSYSMTHPLRVRIRYREPTPVTELRVEIRSSDGTLAALQGITTLQVHFTKAPNMTAYFLT